MLTGIRPRVRGRAPVKRTDDASASAGKDADREMVIPKALVCGFVLRALREQAGIGLEDFARLAKVNRPSISKLEAGRTMLAVHHLDLYAEVIRGHGQGEGGREMRGLRVLAVIERACEALAAKGAVVDWRTVVVFAENRPSAAAYLAVREVCENRPTDSSVLRH